MKGRNLEEGKEKRNLKLDELEPFFINSCLPFVLASGLLPTSNVIPHGVGAWQVIPYINS